jgi:hypothetical protein
MAVGKQLRHAPRSLGPGWSETHRLLSSAIPIAVTNCGQPEQIIEEQNGTTFSFQKVEGLARHMRKFEIANRGAVHPQLLPARGWAASWREQQPTDRQVFAARSNLLV